MEHREPLRRLIPPFASTGRKRRLETSVKERQQLRHSYLETHRSKGKQEEEEEGQVLLPKQPFLPPNIVVLPQTTLVPYFRPDMTLAEISTIVEELALKKNADEVVPHLVATGQLDIIGQCLLIPSFPLQRCALKLLADVTKGEQGCNLSLKFTEALYHMVIRYQQSTMEIALNALRVLENIVMENTKLRDFLFEKTPIFTSFVALCVPSVPDVLVQHLMRFFANSIRPKVGPGGDPISALFIPLVFRTINKTGDLGVLESSLVIVDRLISTDKIHKDDRRLMAFSSRPDTLTFIHALLPMYKSVRPFTVLNVIERISAGSLTCYLYHQGFFEAALQHLQNAKEDDEVGEDCKFSAATLIGNMFLEEDLYSILWHHKTCLPLILYTFANTKSNYIKTGCAHALHIAVHDDAPDAPLQRLLQLGLVGTLISTLETTPKEKQDKPLQIQYLFEPVLRTLNRLYEHPKHQYEQFYKNEGVLKRLENVLHQLMDSSMIDIAEYARCFHSSIENEGASSSSSSSPSTSSRSSSSSLEEQD